MTPRFCASAALLVMASSGANAQERLEINNIYPLNQELFQLSTKAYLFQDNVGFYEVIEGPLEEGPARCIGGGFSERDGVNSIEGICIFGDGEHTFTISWKAGEQGAANTWNVVAGTGRFAGMTGEGIATTGVSILYEAMPRRKSHIVGTVTLKTD